MAKGDEELANSVDSRTQESVAVQVRGRTDGAPTHAGAPFYTGKLRRRKVRETHHSWFSVDIMVSARVISRRSAFSVEASPMDLIRPFRISAIREERAAIRS